MTTHFFEVQPKPDGLTPEAEIVSQSWRQAHLILAKTGATSVGISFPTESRLARAGERRVETLFPKCMRLHGSPETLGALRDALAIRLGDMVKVTQVRMAPTSAPHIRVTRARKAGGLSSGDARRKLAAIERRCAARGESVPEGVRNGLLKREKNAAGERTGPALMLKMMSGSTHQSFHIALNQSPAPASAGSFNSYGISDGVGTVPAF